MLVFNLSKAAAEFFTVTRKGEKISCIEPAPHKTIAESIKTPFFPKDIEAQKNNDFQWQWVVHCVSVKRQKYLLVMDYHSRYCLTFPAGKKGDQYEFFNLVEKHLKSTFRYIAHEKMINTVEVDSCVDVYNSLVNTCAFYQRGDRSVQAHINEVVWHLERLCFEDGMIKENIDCLRFNLFTGQIPRRIKGNKDYLFPNQEYLSYWLKAFSAENRVPFINNDNIIDFSQYVKKC
ncbi:conserved hypothetical protein [Psychromonas ingrahamii 37]|uniref:DUF6933 domain-containing protein n=1 Tax=Psychromonas ingrahamii (strain DSM 17664 / CCUG 51855 / 37) TaxID=357804 RepID=A1SW05_PSYIN|nr:hypothetical protein [Psychromonas ingrahamii]ABM03670.1 conserved hypothetical protein [Psychromonas ingrahamii 37]